MLYNGVFGCHGNTCYVIFIGAILYMIYSTFLTRNQPEVSTTSGSKVMAQIVVFGDLDLDL